MLSEQLLLTSINSQSMPAGIVHLDIESIVIRSRLLLFQVHNIKDKSTQISLSFLLREMTYL